MISIKTDIRALQKLQALLKDLPQGAIGVAGEAVAHYLLGEDTGGGYTHGLKHYVPYKYVTMNQAYGGFVSDKQRRYVMARINEGSIDPGAPHRTGELQRGWHHTPSSHGSIWTLSNRTPYADYVMGGRQSSMHNLIGWRTAGAVIVSNLSGAIRHASAALGKWLRRK